jgi:hypothetical protein
MFDDTTLSSILRTLGRARTILIPLLARIWLRVTAAPLRRMVSP